jgi:hypothetical protein
MQHTNDLLFQFDFNRNDEDSYQMKYDNQAYYFLLLEKERSNPFFELDKFTQE